MSRPQSGVTRERVETFLEELGHLDLAPDSDSDSGGTRDLMFADGFDDCILGVVERFAQPAIILYDKAKVIQKLEERDGMSFEEATEFFDFNIAGAWVGEGTPAFAQLLPEQ